MIINSAQYNASLNQLRKLQDMLQAIRKQSETSGSKSFPILSEPYLVRIKTLQEEIIEYLQQHPAETPLTVAIKGPGIEKGRIKTGTVVRLIKSFQNVIYSVGENIILTPDRVRDLRYTVSEFKRKLKDLFELNLVATEPSSFILAMDLPNATLDLFENINPAILTLNRLIEYLNQIKRGVEQYEGDRNVLLSFKKFANIVNKDIEQIEIMYRTNETPLNASINAYIRDRIRLMLGEPEEGEKTVIGYLVEINTLIYSCEILIEDSITIHCSYSIDLESGLIAALKKKIEMAGQFKMLEGEGRFKITKIERFRVLDETDDE